MTTWMDIKGIMLSEISQRKTNTIWFHIHAESKKNKMNREQTKQNQTHRKKLMIRGQEGWEQNGESGQLYSDGW